MQELVRQAGDRRGAVAVMVAVMMLALVGMLALALDVAAAVSARARLQEAATTAALTAVRQAAVLTRLNSHADLTSAQDAGRQRFIAQATSTPRLTVDSVTVEVVRNELTITSTVKFDATYTTQVAGALGAISPSMTSFATLSVGGRIGASQQMGAFVDIQVMIDVSNSMTIAATPKDTADMQALTNRWPWYALWSDQGQLQPQWYGCQFACHAKISWDNYYYHGNLIFMAEADTSTYPPKQLQPWNFPDPSTFPDSYFTDFYALARANGVTLRIDLLKAATTQIINALTTARDPSKFRFGFYTFDNDVNQIYPLGSPSNVGSAVSDTEVTAVTYCCVDYQTAVDNSITNFGTQWVSSAGDGSSQDGAKKFVVIMTDGVNDYYDSNTAVGRSTATFNPASCQAMKNKGVGVFVIQAATQDNFVADAGSDPVAAFQASQKAMEACASPDSYFLASSPDDISNATQAIINRAVSQPTLITQGNSSIVGK